MDEPAYCMSKAALRFEGSVVQRQRRAAQSLARLGFGKVSMLVKAMLTGKGKMDLTGTKEIEEMRGGSGCCKYCLCASFLSFVSRRRMACYAEGRGRARPQICPRAAKCPPTRLGLLVQDSNSSPSLALPRCACRTDAQWLVSVPAVGKAPQWCE